MDIWTERSETDKRRLRVAAEHEGVGVFADVSPRDAVRFVAALGAALGALRRRKRYRRAMRRKYGR